MALHATRPVVRPAADSQAAGWEQDAPAALEALGLGVLVVDWAFRTRAASPLAAELLRGFSDAQLRAAVEEQQVAGGRRAVRMETADRGTALYVATVPSRRRPGDTVVTLRREELRDDGTLEHMRARFGISVRERQLIAMLRQGRRNHEIAAELGLTLGTVKSYLHRLFERTGVGSRTELLALIERIRLGFE
jgi:DNA-binding CsgD family transcriptional regulator